MNRERKKGRTSHPKASEFTESSRAAATIGDKVLWNGEKFRPSLRTSVPLMGPEGLRASLRGLKASWRDPRVSWRSLRASQGETYGRIEFLPIIQDFVPY